MIQQKMHKRLRLPLQNWLWAAAVMTTLAASLRASTSHNLNTRDVEGGVLVKQQAETQGDVNVMEGFDLSTTLFALLLHTGQLSMALCRSSAACAHPIQGFYISCYTERLISIL